MMSRISIVADDFNVRHMLSLMLQRSGFEIDQAEDGAAAVRNPRVWTSSAATRGMPRLRSWSQTIELLAVFARATHIQLIVEGMETETEATVVRRIGTDMLQGYLFGRLVHSHR